MKQLTLSKEMKRQAEFGGALLKGKRKSRRPFSSKKAMHITFRTNTQRLSSKRKEIETLILGLAGKRGITVYDSCVNSNHVHLLLRSGHRKEFQNYLRELSIKIVRLITGAGKGKALLKKFWESRPWSRIIEWGKSFRAARKYVLRNQLETLGLIVYDRKINTETILKRGPTRFFTPPPRFAPHPAF